MNFLHSRRNVEILGATKLHGFRFRKGVFFPWRLKNLDSFPSKKKWLEKSMPMLNRLNFPSWRVGFFPFSLPKTLQKQQQIPCKQTKALEGQRCMHWLGKDLVAPDLTQEFWINKNPSSQFFATKIHQPMGKFHRNPQLGVSECNLASSDLKVGRVFFSGLFLVALPFCFVT